MKKQSWRSSGLILSPRASVILLLVATVLTAAIVIAWQRQFQANQQVTFSGGGLGSNVEILGSLAKSAKIEHTLLYKEKGSGTAHLLIEYVINNDKAPYQIVDLNLATEEGRVISAFPGRPAVNEPLLHSNGKLYFISNNTSYNNVFAEYDPATGNLKRLDKVADESSYRIIEGDDHQIYIGEYGKGIIEQYDPDGKGKLKNLGKLVGSGYPRYVYTMGSDSRYVYAGMGKGPWYILVYDKQTNQQKTYFDADNVAQASVVKGTDGKWYAKLEGYQGKTRYASIGTDGVPTLLDTTAKVTEQADTTQPCSALVAACVSQSGYDIDLSGIDPQTDGSISLKWRPSGQTNIDWKTKQLTVRVVPQPIKQLFAQSDGTLFGFTDFYGPFVSYDPKAKAATTIGRTTNRNPYDALYLPELKRWLISGYTAATMAYDTTKLWNLTYATESQILTANSNPTQFQPGTATFHYYVTEGNDKLVYVGAHERDRTGGDIGWYDPIAGYKGLLRDPFVDYDVADLKPILNGSKLVYAGDADGAKEAQLLIFDVKTKTVEKSITPLPGVKQLDKIVEVPDEPGNVFGVAHDVIFKVDTKTGKIVYKKPLGGEFAPNLVASDRRLVVGPDKKVWLSISTLASASGVPIAADLARINPVNGTIEKMQSVADLNNMVFLPGAKGYDLYLYGNTGQFATKLRRIKNILPR